MRRIGYSLSILLLLCCLVTGGVFATWIFSDLPTEPQNTASGVSINPFYYKPEEVLPDKEESADMQENHMDLLQNILNHSKYGLNHSNTLSDAVKKEGHLHDQDNISGGNLKHLFTTQESKLLAFVVEYVSATEYILYTFENDDLAMGTVNVDRIPVYKIVLTCQNGKWDALAAVLGHAIVQEYKTSNNKTARTVHPEDFIAGSLRLYQT